MWKLLIGQNPEGKGWRQVTTLSNWSKVTACATGTQNGQLKTLNRDAKTTTTRLFGTMVDRWLGKFFKR